MRKLSSMLALGMALALTLGMTVGAAPSTSTTNSNVTNTVLEETASAIKPSAGVTVAPVTVEKFDTAVKAATKETIEKAVAVNEVKAVVTVFELKGQTGSITLSNVKGVDSSKEYVMLHWKDDGTLEVLNVELSGSSLTFTVDSFSTFALVEVVKAGDNNSDDDDDDDDAVTADGTPAAPKTGETLPVAGVMAVICLAGIVVCASKVRYNK